MRWLCRTRVLPPDLYFNTARSRRAPRHANGQRTVKNNSVPLHHTKRPQDAAVTHATSQHTILLEYYLLSYRLTKNRSDLLSLTLCTSGHSAKPPRQADQPSAFAHHPGSPWLLPPTTRRHQELAYSIARGPTCYLHATAKPLCRVQIHDITVWLSGERRRRGCCQPHHARAMPP
jgi:hypothetical protein